MDEEELEQPKQKINLGSFFEKVDSIEKVSNRALSRSSANFSIINNQKLIINSINVSIEALETKIRDIANYIIIEKKLEKDVEEDRLLEAQDKEQKEAMVERATSMMGQPVQEEGGAQPEQQKGGSLLGALLKLGIGAFALKYMWPALLPLLKGSLGLVGKTVFTKLGAGIGAAVGGTILSLPLLKRFKNPFERKAKETGENIGKSWEEKVNSISEKGQVNTSTGTEVSSDTTYAEGDESMKKTLKDNNLIEDEGGGIEKVDEETKVVENPSKLKLYADYIEEGAEIRENSRGDFSITYPDGRNQILSTVGMSGEGNTIEEKFNSTITNLEAFKKERESFKKERAEQKAISDKMFESDFFKNAELKIKNKNLDLSMSDGSGDVSVEIEALNQRVDGIVASRTGENNKEQNSNLLVPQNTGRVSDASLKVAQADIPFIKVVKNNQLSTSPKSNGLPPEIAAMIS